ncbi:AsmA family protein [Nitrosomonas aestuarii]|uniref:AsmA family protein n=1 Tax=Nitrosomonas aestuarii TaxID=52441 RepID=A0A1I3XVG3_9PROT|nr:AsmA family protein [Nitrosomonas aestuarii]SFK23510.1 AsmA family protein [Nitrosomonas aestuarii]
MKRLIQYGLVFLMLTFFLVAGTVVVIINFDPNALKPVIQQWVKENKKRSFIIDGDLQIDLYPRIGIRLSDLKLSEYQRSDPFASIENIQISVLAWPLLRKQVIVEHIVVKGINAKFIRYQDGRMNFDDLLETDDEPPAFTVDIAKIESADNHLVFMDEITQQIFVLNDLYLTTGRLTSNTAQQISMQSRLISSRMENTDSDSIAPEMTFETQLNVANMAFNDQGFSSDSMRLSIQNNDYADHLTASVSISDVRKSYDQLAAELVQFELAVKQGEQTAQIFLDTPLAARLKDQQWNLSKFRTNFDFFHPAHVGKPVHGRFAGNLNLNMHAESVHTALQGSLAGSTIQAVVQMRNFSEQSYAFDVMIDQLDLDSLLPGQPSQTREPEVEKKTQLSINKMQIPDISVFRDLNLHGSIRIGELSFNDIQSSGIHLTIESGQDRFDIRNPTQ